MTAKAPPPSSAETDAAAALLSDILAAVGTVTPEVQSRVRAVLSAHENALRERLAPMCRLAAAGRLLASTAHELRNPLSVIETSAFVLAESGSDPERRTRHTRRITEQVGLANGILGDLLDATRGRSPFPEPVDLVAVANAALRQLPPEQAALVKLRADDALPPAHAGARRVQQALFNLLTNAMEATQAAGPVEMSVARDAESLVVSVRDGGPGIAVENAGRIFEPLFTTRAQGHGLGLWLSREIARSYGGELTGGNDPRGGAVFSLRLPVARSLGGSAGDR